MPGYYAIDKLILFSGMNDTVFLRRFIELKERLAKMSIYFLYAVRTDLLPKTLVGFFVMHGSLQ